LRFDTRLTDICFNPLPMFAFGGLLQSPTPILCERGAALVSRLTDGLELRR
jgi:hypothetical protein